MNEFIFDLVVLLFTFVVLREAMIYLEEKKIR